MSLPRLTALSTQTLSLLLERQRLQSLSPNATGLRSSSPLHLPQITRNLKQLRAGVLELEKKEGRTEASELLRAQYERMKGMLGVDGEEEGLERFVLLLRSELTVFLAIRIGLLADRIATRLPDVPAQMANVEAAPPFGTPPRSQPSPPEMVPRSEPVYARYTDDPEAGFGEPGILLQTQQRMMEGPCHCCSDLNTFADGFVVFVFFGLFRTRRTFGPIVAFDQSSARHLVSDQRRAGRARWPVGGTGYRA